MVSKTQGARVLVWEQPGLEDQRSPRYTGECKRTYPLVADLSRFHGVTSRARTSTVVSLIGHAFIAIEINQIYRIDYLFEMNTCFSRVATWLNILNVAFSFISVITR